MLQMSVAEWGHEKTPVASGFQDIAYRESRPWVNSPAPILASGSKRSDRESGLLRVGVKHLHGIERILIQVLTNQ
jgi:hypothetical protein